MSMRAKILEFLLNPYLTSKDRVRVVQTLEMLEHIGPFTAPRYQGDVDNECARLRLWVNSSPSPENNTYNTKEYRAWALTCPYRREDWSDEWAQNNWFWRGEL